MKEKGIYLTRGNQDLLKSEEITPVPIDQSGSPEYIDVVKTLNRVKEKHKIEVFCHVLEQQAKNLMSFAKGYEDQVSTMERHATQRKKRAKRSDAGTVALSIGLDIYDELVKFKIKLDDFDQALGTTASLITTQFVGLLTQKAADYLNAARTVVDQAKLELDAGEQKYNWSDRISNVHAQLSALPD